MEQEQIIKQAKEKFLAGLGHFQDELKKLRTGRAHPAMLDGVMVEAYGTQVPLIQVGSITVPEPQLLQITAFDPNNLQAIASSIRDNKALGLNPMDDGRVVRIQIPPLTEERRRDLTKIIGTKVEDCMIALRGARHEALREAEESKKQRQLTEDDLTSIKKQLDDLMAKHKTEVENLAKAKEQEIMTV